MDKAKNQNGIVGSEFTKSSGHHDRSSSAMSNKSNFDVSFGLIDIKKDRGEWCILSSSFQPVLMDNSINQSASFKKVMYSVMGDSDL